MDRDLLDDIRIHPVRVIRGTLVTTLSTPHASEFETAPVDLLPLRLDGIEGDRHAGFVRRSGGREPWYPHGTEMRSGRQLSIVSVEELIQIAAALRTEFVDPGWIGANLVIAGVARLSFLPPGTRLAFEGGTVVVIENQNVPCRRAGKSIGRHAGLPDAEFAFPKVARRLRGVLASVERAGEARAGGAVAVKLPEQWIY